MSTLKERFENFEMKPDESVWNKIDHDSQQMKSHQKARARNTVLGATSLIVVAAVGGLFLNSQKQEKKVLVSVESQEVIAVNNNIERNDIKALSDSPSVEVVEVNNVSKSDVSYGQMEECFSLCDFVIIDDEKDVELNPIEPNESQKIEQIDKNSTVETSSVTLPESATNSSVIVQPADDKRDIPESKSSVTTNKASSSDLVLWIPNAFSPDDDVAENKTFKAVPNDDANIKSFRIYIYSRTGRQVFHSTDINESWDGTYNGTPQPMGSYVYVIQVNDAVKGIQNTKGTITLIR